MFFVFYLGGVLIAYIILLAFIINDGEELQTKDAIKLSAISLLSWIIVILYIALLISLLFNKNHIKR